MNTHAPPHPDPGPAHPPAPAPKARRRAALAMAVLPLMLAGCMGHTAALGDPVATTEVGMTSTWDFTPNSILVTNNTTVTWTNTGDSYHTVTIKELGFNAILKPGEKASLRFERPGTYAFVCEYHQPHMSGRVTVTDLAATPSDSSLAAPNGTSASPGPE